MFGLQNNFDAGFQIKKCPYLVILFMKRFISIFYINEQQPEPADIPLQASLRECGNQVTSFTT
jgi:hypothetical protein